jgi:hypothetical protein
MRSFAPKPASKDTSKKGRLAVNPKQITGIQNVTVSPHVTPVIQKKSICPCDGGCPKCGNDNTVQRKQDKEKDRIKSQTQQTEETGLANSPDHLTSGGMPLSSPMRSFYERHFGRDFSRVRIHTGRHAVQLCKAIDAHAFTYGNHIWTGGHDQYKPSFTMSHELAHVIQQKQPPMLTTMDREKKQPSLNKSPQKIMKRKEKFYWRPTGMSGIKIHNELTRAISKEGEGIDREVGIPNADREKVGFGIYGRADFYKAQPGTNKKLKERRISVYFKKTARKKKCNGEPIGVIGQLNLGEGKPKFIERQKEKKKLHFIAEISKGPTQIRLGELKPADSDLIKTGEQQLKNYKEGIEFVHSNVNHWAETKRINERWKPVKVRFFSPHSLKIPEKYTFKTNSPAKRRELQLVRLIEYQKKTNHKTTITSNFRKIYDPKEEFKHPIKGGLYAKVMSNGLILYYSVPNSLKRLMAEIQRDKVKKYVKDSEVILTNVVGPLRKTPIQRRSLAIQQKSGGSFGPRNVSRDNTNNIRRRKGKNVPTLKDNFNLEKWEADKKKLGIFFKKKERSQEQKQLKFLDIASQAEETLNDQGINSTRGEKLSQKGPRLIKHGKNKLIKIDRIYSKLHFWAQPSTFFLGKLRYKFGDAIVFVSQKVSNLRLILREKLEKFGKKASGSRDSVAGLAIKAFIRAAVAIGAPILKETIAMLVRSLAGGLKNKMEEFFPMDVDKIKEQLPILEKIEGDITKLRSTIEKKISSITDTFENELQMLSNIADKARKFGEHIEYAVYALQCVTPPLWGCLKLLFKKAIARAADKVLNWCWTREKFANLAWKLGFSWFSKLPKNIAEKTATMIEALPIIKERVGKIFDRSEFVDVLEQPKIKCGSKVSAKDEAIQELFFAIQEKYGPQKNELFIKGMKKYGIDPQEKIELNIQQIKALEAKLLSIDISEADLSEYISTNPTPVREKGSAVDLVEFLNHVKKTMALARKKANRKSWQRTLKKHKRILAKLGPGEFWVGRFGPTELVKGRASDLDFVMKTTEGEERFGLVDLTIDNKSFDCKAHTINVVITEAIFYDNTGKEVASPNNILNMVKTIKIKHRANAMKKVLKDNDIKDCRASG